MASYMTIRKGSITAKISKYHKFLSVCLYSDQIMYND